MITSHQLTTMLLFRRLGALELGACRMASECVKHHEYGVTKVTGMDAYGSYGAGREV